MISLKKSTFTKQLSYQLEVYIMYPYSANVFMLYLFAA